MFQFWNKHIIGKEAYFRFSAGEENFQLGINLVSAYEFTPTITVLAFTNFLAGEKLIKLLEKEKEISLTVNGPNELLTKLDMKSDTFSLIGFTKTRKKAYEACMKLQ